MLEYCVYLLYCAKAVLLKALPLRVLFAIGTAAGFCGWLVFGNYRRLALRNVTMVFGHEKSAREVRGLVRRHFSTDGRNLLCTVKLSSIPVEKIIERMEVENIDAMHRQLRAGVPVVVLRHMATWEVFAQLMPHFLNYTRTASIYQKLRNQFIDAHVRRARSRTGLELFDRKEGF